MFHANAVFHFPRPSASFKPAATAAAANSDATVASSDNAEDATGTCMPVSGTRVVGTAACYDSTAQPPADHAAVGPLRPPASQHSQTGDLASSTRHTASSCDGGSAQAQPSSAPQVLDPPSLLSNGMAVRNLPQLQLAGE